MIARAEQGISGSGLNCHSCSGTSNLCTNSSDEGTVIDCGEGVTTCLIATDGSSTARGCGLVGLSPEGKCNNLTNTATLLEYATSTTTTTTTTSTTTTTLSTSTTTSSGTTTLSSGEAQSVVGLSTTL